MRSSIVILALVSRASDTTRIPPVFRTANGLWATFNDPRHYFGRIGDIPATR